MTTSYSRVGIKIFPAFFIAALFVLFCLSLPLDVKAQESQKIEAKVIARVNIQNCLLSQEGKTLAVECDFINNGDIQPDIRYAIQLVRKDSEGDVFIVDEKVYPETLALRAGEILHKKIEYTAPSYVGGTNEVWIIASTSEGTSLANMKVGVTTHTAEAGSVFISSCYLTVNEDVAPTQYTLRQGVDIAPVETLTAHCAVKNMGDAKKLTPTYEIYRRNKFGAKVESIPSVSNEPLNIGENEDTLYEFIIPHPSEPQAYDTVVRLTSGNSLVSNAVAIHYVIQGASATIQNISLDKTSYQKGEAAQVKIFWTGSADLFTASRGRGTKSDATTLTGALTSSGQACGELTMPIAQENTPESRSVHLEVPIGTDCTNPTVVIRILDSQGQVLAEKSVATHSVLSGAVGVFDKVAAAIAAGIALIVMIIYFFYRRNRERRRMPPYLGGGTTVALFPLFFLGACAFLFLGAQPVQADSVYLGGGYWMTAGINKTVYSPGETMVVTGSSFCSVCAWNSPGAGDLHSSEGTTLATNVPTGEQYGFVSTPSGSDIQDHNFTAPTTPGTYYMHFDFNVVEVDWSDVDWSYTYTRFSSTYDIPYTVAGSVPTASISANPGSITSGGSSTLNYSCGNATSASIDNGVGGVSASGGSSTVSPGGSTTYTLTCTGAGGSTQAQTTVTVNPPGNQSPNAPTISSAFNGMMYANRDYWFDYTATDPDGDNIAYGIDINLDGNNDTGSPYGTPVASGTTQRIHMGTYPAGIHTIRAITYDTRGGVSGWSYHSFTINDVSDVTAFGVSNLSGTPGQNFNLTATFRNNGPGNTGIPFPATILLYNSIGGTPTVLRSMTLGVGNPVGFPAGYQEPQSASWTAPSSGGTWYYRACADSTSDGSGGVINEPDEGNNCSGYATITIPVADPALNAACSVSSTLVELNQNVSRTASPSGGNGSYSYSWGGSDGLSGSSSSVTRSYSSIGSKSGWVAINSGTQSGTYACAPVNVVDTPACGNANGVATIYPPSSGLCSKGAASGVTTNPNSYDWSCSAGSGATSCSAPRTPAPINGSCGPSHGITTSSTPTIGLCSQGTPSGVSDTGSSYGWTCSGSNGGSNASCSATKVVSCGADVTVNGSNGPTSVTIGSSMSVAWSTANAVSCTSSGAGWTGSPSPAGGNSAITASQSSNYSITCTSSTGNTCSDSVSVTATAPPVPTVSLAVNGNTASPVTVGTTGNMTVGWNTANATSCQAIAGTGWTGAKAVPSGSEDVPVAASTYWLQCTGPGGTTASSLQTKFPDTLKLCRNSCSSNATPSGTNTSTGSITIAAGGTEQLVACFNSSTTCDTSSADVTGSATWSEGGGSAVSLSGSSPKIITGNQAGTESVSATYSGQTARTNVTVTCVPTFSCDNAPSGGNYCQNENVPAFDNGCGVSISNCPGTKTCNYNWTEVAP